MKIRITEVHQQDSYYGYNNVIGLTGEATIVEPTNLSELGNKGWKYVEMEIEHGDPFTFFACKFEEVND